MDFLKRITTRFVRDRIQETTWENCAYIKHLYQAERIIARGGPHSAFEGMLLAGLKSKYPVECDCI
ncbi:MAG TPA: hypothetical protein GX739_01600 [Firmicutes bacterium]|nr:hypothetical protein [Bacillota bacterium]